MMKRLFAAGLAMLLSASAFAQCAAPPGLSLQNWLAVCGRYAQQAYAAGMGGGMSYEAFILAAYQQYIAATNTMPMVQPAAPPAWFPQMPGTGIMPPQAPALMPTCPLGAMQCFNGWARSCQRVGNGTMWITSQRRC